MTTRRLPDHATTTNICAFIRAGAFQWVSAVACGVSKAKFAEWMSGETCEELEFQAAVNQASAQARVVVEVEVFKKKGLSWLLKGPGRERPGEPGWASQVALTGPKGGALESKVTSTNIPAPAENYSKLTMEERLQLRTLRDKARTTASDIASPIDQAIIAEAEDGE